MNTILTSPPTTAIVVYFNNGVNATRPWWVGVKEGRAIVATLGDCRNVATAIAAAVQVCRTVNAPLIVPPWLTSLAAAIQHSADPNDFAGLLALYRRGQQPAARLDEATLGAIEEEWIGLEYCRQPFLY
jgi:hypothetical protein